jgi:hypothetical protein
MSLCRKHVSELSSRQMLVRANLVSKVQPGSAAKGCFGEAWFDFDRTVAVLTVSAGQFSTLEHRPSRLRAKATKQTVVVATFGVQAALAWQ